MKDRRCQLWHLIFWKIWLDGWYATTTTSIIINNDCNILEKVLVNLRAEPSFLLKLNASSINALEHKTVEYTLIL